MVDIIGYFTSNIWISLAIIANLISFIAAFYKRKWHSQGFFDSAKEILEYQCGIAGFGALIISIFFGNYSNMSIFSIVGYILLCLIIIFPVSLCVGGSAAFIVSIPGGFMGDFLAEKIVTASKFKNKWNILEIYCKNINILYTSNNPNFQVLSPEVQIKFIRMINDLEKNDDSIKFLEKLHTPPCLRMMDDVQLAARKKIQEFDLTYLL